jgi:hypothetical protein
VAQPDGKYQGSADYQLGSGVYDQNYLIANVDLTNTGNVGEVIRVKVGWQQEGFADITATKTVRLPFGASRTIHFHMPVGSIADGAVAIDRLQSWQTGHNDGQIGHFHVKILNTFGQVH